MRIIKLYILEFFQLAGAIQFNCAKNQILYFAYYVA